ncbi:translocation protein SEC63 homolog [Malaya genurostris]|uniref:translocation protein SEC63 homolog n=1 Tax=Malaya genurostris TaxID=325434 RepID=UPI0026F3D36D|nr:translocation protein SEC63 homolog [Malaya genurostris]
MGGQKFQYDESGATFFYFILSFLALILIPATFYFWPRKKKEDPERFKAECQCESCIQKRILISHSDPYKGVKAFITKVAIIGGWALLAFLTYKVSQFDYEMSNFDPYEILGVPLGSSQKDIKKAYRTLSVILHPDKETGDEKAFMKLTKAYQALTDEEARKNWEKYGNPDGPGATSFGIALPSWIVEKENSVWVLGLYALVFMVALPTVVGTWWYRSIRYSGDKVLLDTTQMYFYFFHKTPHMALKRVVMILAASLEFDKRHNTQVVERQSDNEEVPMLIKQLPNLNEKCKELPLCRMYSIKARAILHAHLSRMPLNPNTLDKDRQFIVKKCPHLIQEMVSCVNQLIMLAYARRISKLPTIETIENCMKLSPMIIQGLWEFKNPLLQLPHVTDDHLRYFVSKKRPIRNLQQFAQLPPEESRAVLRSLSDFEYENVVKVLGKMPLIDFSVKCEVVDDENSNVVTAGAIVTVTVELVRRSMSELFGDASAKEKQGITEENEEGAEGAEDGAEGATVKEENAKTKKLVWQPKPSKGGHKSKSKGGANKSKQQRQAAAAAAAAQAQNQATKSDKTKTNEKARKDDSDADSGAESDNDGSTDEDKKSSMEDDDVEWEKFQQKINKREKLEGKSKVSHPVHCPLFPEEKFEYWWTYICDRKSRTLLTAPYQVTSLVQHEEVHLKFTAPKWPGVYNFTVCLRSDSYLGMDQQVDLKLDVKEAAAIPTEHPQWDVSESESDANEQQANESEFTTDSSDAENDDN